MKKYIPLDFDEKGKVILGREKNTPTPNGTIPAIFIPGGSDEGKQGLKSISISPAIQTTPALDSLFPIYWDDLTEEQKYPWGSGVNVTASVTEDELTRVFPSAGGGYEVGDFTVTITPTDDWYIYDGINDVWGGKGEPVVCPLHGVVVEDGVTYLIESTELAINCANMVIDLEEEELPDGADTFYISVNVPVSN